MERVVTVEGMHCADCERAVESALRDLPGVVRAVANAQNGDVHIEADASVSHAMLREAVEEAGYELAGP